MKSSNVIVDDDIVYTWNISHLEFDDEISLI